MKDSKVVQIADWRKKKRGDEGERGDWLFDLRVFAGPNGFEGSVIDKNEAFSHLATGDEMRMHADALDQLVWFLRQMAEEVTPTDNGMPLATATIYKSSLTRVRVNDDEFGTEEQLAWLDERWDDAKEASRKASVPA